MEESYLWVSNVSSNINEVIRSVLNFFFLTMRFYTHEKHKKNTRHQKVPKALKASKSTKNIKAQPSKSTKTQISE